ncbi:unnamed protein product [Protopolystoma xenopodis]|uniref:Uncharacterized protein n=1 Tax=Protopolystoma xenopodis TaxID=117903 RepID=A0A3S5CDQ0_9PLAT|nr:unnamed protein product [Protopolystoma xenopodis]
MDELCSEVYLSIYIDTCSLTSRKLLESTWPECLRPGLHPTRPAFPDGRRCLLSACTVVLQTRTLGRHADRLSLCFFLSCSIFLSLSLDLALATSFSHSGGRGEPLRVCIGFYACGSVHWPEPALG